MNGAYVTAGSYDASKGQSHLPDMLSRWGRWLRLHDGGLDIGIRNPVFAPLFRFCPDIDSWVRWGIGDLFVVSDICPPPDASVPPGSAVVVDGVPPLYVRLLPLKLLGHGRVGVVPGRGLEEEKAPVPAIPSLWMPPIALVPYRPGLAPPSRLVVLALIPGSIW